MSDFLTVDVWSDIVCPWCYVGREHLMRAIQRVDLAGNVQLIHHAFQLDPDRTASEPLPSWLAKRFGPDHAQISGRVAAVGKTVGLTLDFPNAIAANTRAGHRLVHLATRQGRGDAMLERLMCAHFADGIDIADPDALHTLGVELGLAAPEVKEVVTRGTYDDAVQADIDVARDLGIRGVPFFVFNRRFALSGAQPVSVFEDALKQAREPVSSNLGNEPSGPA